MLWRLIRLQDALYSLNKAIQIKPNLVVAKSNRDMLLRQFHTNSLDGLKNIKMPNVLSFGDKFNGFLNLNQYF
jgi:hypothetical protein